MLGPEHTLRADLTPNPLSRWEKGLGGASPPGLLDSTRLAFAPFPPNPMRVNRVGRPSSPYAGAAGPELARQEARSDSGAPRGPAPGPLEVGLPVPLLPPPPRYRRKFAA